MPRSSIELELCAVLQRVGAIDLEVAKGEWTFIECGAGRLCAANASAAVPGTGSPPSLEQVLDAINAAQEGRAAQPPSGWGLHPLAQLIQRSALALEMALSTPLPAWLPLCGGVPACGISSLAQHVRARAHAVADLLDAFHAPDRDGGAELARRWDAADSLVRLLLDSALGCLLLHWIATEPARAHSLESSLLNAGSSLRLESLQPWMAVVTGLVPPNGDARSWLAAPSSLHYAGVEVAGCFVAALHGCERLLDGASPLLLNAWRVCIAAAPLLGATVLAAFLSDAAALASTHVRLLARGCGWAHTSAGHTLLGLVRLFRGLKRNALRDRVDSVGGALPASLVLGTLLFVPLFLALPVVACWFAVFQACALAVLAVRVALWWLQEIANGVQWARLGARLLTPSALECDRVSLALLGDGAPLKFRLRPHPAPLSRLLLAPLAISLRKAAEHVSGRGLLRFLLTGAPLDELKAAAQWKDGAA